MNSPAVNPRISPVAPEEIGAAIATLALAFTTDPAARWSWPRAENFLQHFPALVRAFAGNSFKLGYAEQIDDFAGMAIWLPPGEKSDEAALGSLIDATAPAAILKDAEQLFSQMAHFHPKEPHWYLPLIGVDPARQGQRIGDQLMKHGLARCDARQELAYLESSTPRNISFYERFGFQRLGAIQHGSSPTLVPMLRKPQRA